MSTKNKEAEHLSEAEFLKCLAERIRGAETKTTKVISIIGGAGAGKTTLASKLCAELKSGNSIGTDDYLIKDRAFRRKYLEEKNPQEKYDLSLLNKHVRQISNLKKDEFILVPKYDDSTGLAVDTEDKLFNKKVGKVEYLIIEGDFHFVENCNLLIYFDVPDEIRLRNRIVRDIEKSREANTTEIERMFYLRQESYHLPYTLPVKEKAEIIVEVLAKKTGEGYKYEYLLKEKY